MGGLHQEISFHALVAPHVAITGVTASICFHGRMNMPALAKGYDGIATKILPAVRRFFE